MKSLPIIPILSVCFLLNPSILFCQSSSTAKLKNQIEIHPLLKELNRQIPKNSIEFSIFGRYDKHAEYDSRYANRAQVNRTTLSGFSYGESVTYKRKYKENIFIRLGLGYYKLSINHIKQSTPFGGTATSRNINYDDNSTRLLYSTPYYHYNTLQLYAGLEKEYFLKNNWNLTAGFDLLYYYTFSQRYNLNHINNQPDYRTNNNRSLGKGIVVQIGLIRKFSTLYITPKINIPVYQSLKTDPVFLEESENMTKWFNGIGLSLTIGKLF